MSQTVTMHSMIYLTCDAFTMTRLFLPEDGSTMYIILSAGGSSLET